MRHNFVFSKQFLYLVLLPILYGSNLMPLQTTYRTVITLKNVNKTALVEEAYT